MAHMTFDARPTLPTWHGLAARLSTQLALWRERLRERHFLLAMSERDLRDIGMNRVDAQREAAKPFWRE